MVAGVHFSSPMNSTFPLEVSTTCAKAATRARTRVATIGSHSLDIVVIWYGVPRSKTRNKSSHMPAILSIGITKPSLQLRFFNDWNVNQVQQQETNCPYTV